MKNSLVTAALALAGLTLGAAEDPFSVLPSVSIPAASSITDHAKMAGMYGFHPLGNRPIIPADSRFRIGTNGTDLYLTAETAVGPAGILQKGRSSSTVFADDCYEFILVPHPETPDPDTYHLIVNNRGTKYAIARKGGQFIAWDPEIKTSGEVKDGKWTFQVTLPLVNVGMDKWTPGKPIGLRFCKNWKRLTRDYGGGCQSSWSQIGTAFFNSSSIPMVTFDPEAPAVQMLSPDFKDYSGMRASIANFGRTAKKYRMIWKFYPSSSQKVDDQETIEVAAGETKEIKLSVPQFTEMENAKLLFSILSEDGTKNYYTRSMRIDRTRPLTVFADPGNKDSQRVAIRYAVYPYFNQLFIQADAGACPAGTEFGKVTAEVSAADGKKLAEAEMEAKPENMFEILMDVPDLAEYTKKSGSPDYVLTVRMSKMKGGVFTRKFKRQVFAWEHNKLGTGDVLLPPYTALKVKGNTVETILRKHTLNGTGLWEKVTAEQKDVLKKGGIRLEVTDDSGVHQAEGELKFTEKRDTMVRDEANWVAGSVKGTTRSEWDYDGMMKTWLTLAPGKAKSVKIVIPFEAKQAELLHACCDGLRSNYAGYVPAGEGIVWKSSQAHRNEIKTSYVPYIWIGTAERGFCVFGENDKGWVPVKEIPAQQIVRNADGSVDLILNLIPTETEWKEPRTILIGFQATPVKPRPENWRRQWPGWFYGSKNSKELIAGDYLDKRMTWYGSCLYWGSNGGSGALYPRDMDITFWKEMRKVRDARKVGPEAQAFLKKWMEGYKDDPPNVQKSFWNHVKAGFGNAAVGFNPKAPVVFYTNARGESFCSQEAATFIDEWMRETFQAAIRDRPPMKREGRDYSVDTGDSFRDFAVWWYHQMLEIGVTDNIYWDDVYLSSNNNHGKVNPEAYYLPDGRFQPSVGLFNLRALIRRCAVLQYEMGKPAWNMCHMTNTMLPPVYSFAQTHLDWENVSSRPYQEQYSREYIRAATIGKHTGNVIGTIGNYGGKGTLPAAFVKRTGAGVAITHEITRSAPEHYGPEYVDTYLILYKFGYGRPEVKVWNYWQEDYPADIQGGESSSLFMKKGNDAILVLCDYKSGGKYTVRFKDGYKPVSAINAETGEPIPVKDGVIEHELKQYDFVIISMKGE